MKRLWHSRCLPVRSESKGWRTLHTPEGDLGLKTIVRQIGTWPMSLLDRKDRPVLEVGLTLGRSRSRRSTQVVSISPPGEGAP